MCVARRFSSGLQQRRRLLCICRKLEKLKLIHYVTGVSLNVGKVGLAKVSYNTYTAKEHRTESGTEQLLPGLLVRDCMVLASPARAHGDEWNELWHSVHSICKFACRF